MSDVSENRESFMMEDGNSAAESRHAHEEAEGEKLREDYCEKALDDLVWRIMDGQEYPRHVCHQQINLMDILCESDASDIAGIIIRELDRPGGIFNEIETLVQNYFRDSDWHERRIAELIEEAQEND